MGSRIPTGEDIYAAEGTSIFGPFKKASEFKQDIKLECKCKCSDDLGYRIRQIDDMLRGAVQTINQIGNEVADLRTNGPTGYYRFVPFPPRTGTTVPPPTPNTSAPRPMTGTTAPPPISGSQAQVPRPGPQGPSGGYGSGNMDSAGSSMGPCNNPNCTVPGCGGAPIAPNPSLVNQPPTNPSRVSQPPVTSSPAAHGNPPSTASYNPPGLPPSKTQPPVPAPKKRSLHVPKSPQEAGGGDHFHADEDILEDVGKIFMDDKMDTGDDVSVDEKKDSEDEGGASVGIKKDSEEDASADVKKASEEGGSVDDKKDADDDASADVKKDSEEDASADVKKG